ncbi:hypothetical protein CMQ_780 [Grosmannia clavigera kw1407]|uniref:Uncharacterized protein n=1 Tax=Grosmannia clavigera (strain kw1407 / UAMH 11150) TaxID=655863 RepID=F0XCI8_GROCL|nr:uncharacterized protein CMQ_780 [Grosmannia clavigera kw1407]EFX03852.1 hypothetical protein CMQ_780 [Grosmannia clavigera kw1407]
MAERPEPLSQDTNGVMQQVVRLPRLVSRLQWHLRAALQTGQEDVDYSGRLNGAVCAICVISGGCPTKCCVREGITYSYGSGPVQRRAFLLSAALAKQAPVWWTPVCRSGLAVRRRSAYRHRIPIKSDRGAVLLCMQTFWKNGRTWVCKR